MLNTRFGPVRLLLTLSIVVLGPSGAPASGVGGADEGVVVVSESPGRIELFVTAPRDGMPSLTKRRFYVAVPPGATASVERVGGDFLVRDALPEEVAWFDGADGIAPSFRFPGEPVSVAGPFTFRNTRLIAVDCHLRQLNPGSNEVREWTGYPVVVRYPRPQRTVGRAHADPLVADVVANGDVFPAPPRPARSAAQGTPDPHFSRSPNWIKMEVEQRGVYAVSGAELAQIVPPPGVGDPRTFRVFTGSGFEQRRELSDLDASWRPGNWMTEVAIHVEGDTDGVFEAGDRILFYAVGAVGWMDHFDSSAADTVYYQHGRATRNYYYLTWGGNFVGDPLRMPTMSAAPTADGDVTSFRERVYLERNKVSDFDYGGDFWLWEKIPRATGEFTLVLDRVEIMDLVPSVPQQFRTVALAPYTGNIDPDDGTSWDRGHHAVYQSTPPGTFTPNTIGDYLWDANSDEYSYEHARPVELTGYFLAEGTNRIDLKLPRDENAKDWMYFAWLSLAYQRQLKARDGRLGFDSPDTTGTVNFRVRGFAPSTGTIHVFDVGDRFTVRRLTGVEVADDGGGRRVRFSSSFGGGRGHFWTASDGGLMQVASLRWYNAVELRNATTAPRMLIVTPPLSSFMLAADRLAGFRRNHLARFGSGAVSVVTTEQIYDNFSGGQRDPFAIRNYVKFLYELDGGGAPTLAYLLLLGDANMDFMNHASTTVDRVPTFLYDQIDRAEETFATDEWYAHMDESDQSPGYSVGDVGVGRLPAGSGNEAFALVDKVIAYEVDSPAGEWRNQVILVADDEGPAGHSCEPWFTNQSEVITLLHMPQYIDVQKVYLTDYPSLAGPKPASRRDLLEKWNSGAVAINYIGHGSSVVIADEIVFVDDDIPKLNNGLRLPIFMALSCTVGDFANPSKKSLSEELLLKNDGGAIGTVTASALSGVFTNEYLAYGLFQHLLPRKPGGKTALGADLVRAKLESLAGDCAVDTVPCGYVNRELNNWKYNLLSDPSLRTKVPAQQILLTPDGPDTLVAGIRKQLSGRVMTNGAVDTGFNGTVRVRVHEPNQLKTSERCALTYRLRGGTIFRGTTDVVDGRFTVNFRVPRYAKPGAGAFFTAYADAEGAADAGASFDSTLSISLPTLADSLALVPIDGAPRVRFGFKSGLNVVKPGESLQAIIRDQDGVNVLNTTAEGRHALLIDDSPVPFDVTQFFEFDHGGTDTSGVLTYPLPDLPVGEHRAILRVADSFAQTTLDTLTFAVTDPMDFFAEVVMNYPNPFVSSTKFLIRLSNPANIRLDIYTVSGKRIRRLEENRDGGEEWISWDGRDHLGDEIANGTYLYVATVDFEGVDRPPLVIRGKLTKIQ